MMNRSKTLAWSIAAFTALLLLALTAVLFLPRLINTDLVRTGIESAVSRDLGGTFTFESIGLTVLPRPYIRIRGPKIAIPGKVTASFSSLDIRPMLLPLFRGRFRAKSVHLERPEATIVLPEAPQPSAKRKKPVPDQGSPLDQVLAVAARQMPGIAITIDGGSIAVTRGGLTILTVRELQSSIAFLQDEAGTAPSSLQEYQVDGGARSVIDAPGREEGPLRLSLERFQLRPGVLSFTGARLRVADLSASLSGRLDQYLSARMQADVNASGKAGPEVIGRLAERASLPPRLVPRTAVSLSGVRIRWDGNELQAAGKASVGGPSLTFAVTRSPERFTLKELTVIDDESRATVALARTEGSLDLSYTGDLVQSTLDDLFGHELLRFGRIKGDLRVHLPLDGPAAMTADGVLGMEQLVVPWRSAVPFTIDRLHVTAQGGRLQVDPAAITLGGSQGLVTGSLSADPEGLMLDLDLSSPKIAWDDLRELFARREERQRSGGGENAERQQTTERTFVVKGPLRVDVERFTAGRLSLGDVRGTVALERNRTTAELDHANLCGISLSGTLRTIDRGAEVALDARVRGGSVGEAVPCIMTDGPEISGTYDLTGRFTGSGPWEDLVPSLYGDLDLTVRTGRIKSSRVVKGIIAYLNSTSLLKSSHTSLQHEGVPFETILFRGSVRDRIITMRQGLIKGRDLHLAADGTVDLRTDTLSLNVLAAPFTTMDRLLGSIPIVKQLVGNALIVVPARVEGTVQRPDVKPLAASGVGTNVSNLMKNIVQAPMKIVDPALPREK